MVAKKKGSGYLSNELSYFRRKFVHLQSLEESVTKVLCEDITVRKCTKIIKHSIYIVAVHFIMDK